MYVSYSQAECEKVLNTRNVVWAVNTIEWMCRASACSSL